MPKPYCPPRWAEMILTLQRGFDHRVFRSTAPMRELCVHVLNKPVIVRGSVRWKQREPVE